MPDKTLDLDKLSEGDTPVVEATGDGEMPVVPDNEGAGEQKPVILAKDGVHTISYDKLVEARESRREALQLAQEAREQAKQYQAEVEAMKQKIIELSQPKEQEFQVDLGDFSEEALQKAFEGLTKHQQQLVAKESERLKKEMEATIARYEQSQQELAAQEHANTILSAHPDIHSILESDELEAYILSKSASEQVQLRKTLEAGSAKQIVGMFDDYKKSGYFLKDAAREAAANVKATKGVPNSLSDVPSGRTSHASKADAMREMDGLNLLGAMEDMSPEEIEAYLNNHL